MNPMLTFFKGLFNKHKPGIGIELTPDRINVVELQKKGNVLKLAALATAEVPENVFQDGQIIDSPITSIPKSARLIMSAQVLITRP